MDVTVALLFVMAGMMDVSLFDAKERQGLLWWPIAVLYVVIHAFLIAMLVTVIRRVRRKEESWFGDLAIKGLYIPWIYYFLGVFASVWYFK
jgi:NADH:ubiquinone oxidoreductase subunit 6 (subunit J)